MTTHHNKYRGLGSGLILREAGVGGSNPLTPTNILRAFCRFSLWSICWILLALTLSAISRYGSTALLLIGCPRRKMQSGKSKCQKPSRQPLVSAAGFPKSPIYRRTVYISPAMQWTYLVQLTSHSKNFGVPKGAVPENSLGEWMAISDALSTAEVVSVRCMG